MIGVHSWSFWCVSLIINIIVVYPCRDYVVECCCSQACEVEELPTTVISTAADVVVVVVAVVTVSESVTI